jgi:hypothetical protein
MSDINPGLREKFDALFEEWQRAIQDPKVQLSSRPQDYIDNEPYRAIVKLGKDALPFIIEKLEHGVFLLNQAVADIEGIRMEEIIGKEKRFPSEQEKSELLINWWKSKREQ